MTAHYAIYFEAILAPVGKAMAESMLIGMCIYLCKTVGTMLCMRGVPVLQTVIGVFLGCITLFQLTHLLRGATKEAFLSRL